MRLSPRLGFFVEPLDVPIELLAVDPPHPSAPDLDRGELPRPDERVHLRDADAQVGSDIFEREEAGFDLGPRRLGGGGGHVRTIPRHSDGYVVLNAFARV